MANEIPLVSVIIPMYNVEKYIDQTLDSVLAQSLKNIEVIVVDDCSTDNSANIVESWIPRFEGRLKLIHTKVNRKCAGIPRNKGLEFSRGKYIYFLDSDDVIVVEALENFYNVAEQNQADVVICEKYFYSDGVGENFLRNIKLFGNVYNTQIGQINDILSVRIMAWNQNFFEVYPFLKFVKRDFLVENEIKFLPIMQEDSIWTFEIICLAKKIMLFPQPKYVHRIYKGSLSSEALSYDFNIPTIRQKLDRIVNGLKHVDEFMSRMEFFKENPDYRYLVINQIVMQNIGWIARSYRQIPESVLYENFKEALTLKANDLDSLISCFITTAVTIFKKSESV